MKLTKKEKVAGYDKIAMKAGYAELVIFDLVNNRFSKPVIVKESLYERGATGHLAMRMSPRAGEALFLLEWHVPGQSINSVHMTESQLSELSQTAAAGTIWDRMVTNAYYQLLAELKRPIKRAAA